MEGENKHQPIETGVDKLLHIVNDRTEISLTKAANLLKVPKHIVDHWANSLEDAGLIISRLNWREKYLMSLDFYKQSTGFKKSFGRQIKAFYESTSVGEDEKAKKKRQEIEKKLEILDHKLDQLKNFEKEMDRQRNIFSQQKSNLREREVKLVEQMKILEMKTESAIRREKEIEKKQSVWEEAMTKLHKDMTIKLVTFAREQSQVLGISYQKLMRKFIAALDKTHREHKQKRREINHLKPVVSKPTPAKRTAQKKNSTKRKTPAKRKTSVRKTRK
ncbi:MAG: hypothetical protein ABIE94_02165 [archaeon]